MAVCLPFALATKVDEWVNEKLIKCTHSQSATSANLKVQNSTAKILFLVMFKNINLRKWLIQKEFLIKIHS